MKVDVYVKVPHSVKVNVHVFLDNKAALDSINAMKVSKPQTKEKCTQPVQGTETEPKNQPSGLL